MLRCAMGVLFLFASCAGTAQSADRTVLPGPIPAVVLRVVDGDTVDVRARVWLGQDVAVRVRLAGIDAPERRSRCAAERNLAGEALGHMRYLLRQPQITLRNIRRAKYAGRVIAEIWTTQTGNVSAKMLSAGLARAYSGHARQRWCCEKRLCGTMQRFGLTRRVLSGRSVRAMPRHDIARSMRP
jgi:endonuclease YncB( thermonuclease family)